MSALTCRACLPFDCTGFAGEPDFYSLYSLEGPPFRFVLNCPPSYDCDSASFIDLPCCNKIIHVDLSGVTGEQRIQKINDAVSECWNALQFCAGGSFGSGPNGEVELFWNLPAKCEYPCPDNNIFTYQVAAGTVLGSSQANADAAARAYACEIAFKNKICLGPIQAEACVNVAYTTLLSPSGIGPFTFFVIAGSLPPGLAILQVGLLSARIQGTPTTPGLYTFTIRALNGAGNWMDKPYTIDILGVSDVAPLPDATVNNFYTYTFSGAGGTAPLVYSISAGAIPTGMTLSSAGVLSGTPTLAAGSSFTLKVTDAANRSCTKAFTLLVKPGACAQNVQDMVWAVTDYSDPGGSGAAALAGGTGTMDVTGLFPLHPGYCDIVYGHVTATASLCNDAGPDYTATVDITVTGVSAACPFGGVGNIYWSILVNGVLKGSGLGVGAIIPSPQHVVFTINVPTGATTAFNIQLNIGGLTSGHLVLSITPALHP